MTLIYFGIALIYMLPTFIAEFRESEHSSAVFAFNLFLGWTVIVWLGCFVLACLSRRRVSIFDESDPCFGVTIRFEIIDETTENYSDRG